jgi:geranylgeranyl diphosphate synthase type II
LLESREFRIFGGAIVDGAEYLAAQREKIDQFLDETLPAQDSTLHKAMRYSLFAGGKRLRPGLAIAAYEAVEGASPDIIRIASTLELIHTYSLIHDDLPAMDDDDYRRGKPTNHKAFNEAIAILAGDALLTLAFEVASHPATPTNGIREGARLQVVRELAEGSGSVGMVGGQAVDIESEGKAIDAERLEYIHKHKTGKLFRAAVRIGALMGGTTAEQLDLLTTYSEDIGLAFQINDDILNVVGALEELGKSANSDAARGKSTYPAFFGVDASREKVKVLTAQAIQALEPFGTSADPLRALAIFQLSRTS